MRDRGPKSIKNKIHPTEDDIIHTVVDDPIRVDDLGEKAALEYLRDILATWLYLMMERYGNTTRKELVGNHPDSIDAIEEKLICDLSTMDYYDASIERASDFRPKERVFPEDVFASIAEVHNITAGNICDIMNAKNLIKQRKRECIQRRF